MALVPCYRGCVNAWECDENDHLNVRFYLSKANQGLPFALEAIGMPPSVLQRNAARLRIRARGQARWRLSHRTSSQCMRHTLQSSTFVSCNPPARSA